ncbi:hypothetical protein SynA18461_01982 [Synechococcus sp. A18-46.1]|nr:hypothetical protein SynA18461_01982 [Synechococcus sp. A18-46.1]
MYLLHLQDLSLLGSLEQNSLIFVFIRKNLEARDTSSV